MEAGGEYYMEGFMQMQGAEHVFKTVTVKGSSCYLILAKDSTVVEVIDFFPAKRLLPVIRWGIEHIAAIGALT